MDTFATCVLFPFTLIFLELAPWAGDFRQICDLARIIISKLDVFLKCGQ